MVFIFNTKLPTNSRLLRALKKIFGIGKGTLLKIKNEFGLTSKMLVRNLRTRLKKKIINYVENNYLYGQDLKMQILYDEIRIRNLRNYKGMRKRFELPHRGQRTHTNARTIKRSRRKTNEKKK